MPTIEKLERDAEALEQAGELEMALECWRQLAALERSRYHLVNLGRVALELDLLGEAEGALRTATQVAPQDAEAYVKLGLVYERKRDVASAMRSYQMGVDLRDDPAVRILLATTQDALGHKGQARENFERVIAQEPENEEAWFGLGLSLRFEDRDRAIRCFERAIEQNPQLSAAHRELGLGLWAERKNGEAERSLRTALELDPSDAWAHSYLGRVCLSFRRVDEAEAEFGRAADLWPESAFFRCELGELYEKTGRIREAETAFLTALSLESHDPHANLKFGEFLRKQGNLEKAAIYLRRAAAADPTDGRPRKILQEMGLDTK